MGVRLPRRLGGPFHFGPTITPDLANYCGTGGAVCGDKRRRERRVGRLWRHDLCRLAPTIRVRRANSGQPRRRPGTFPPNRFGLYDMHGNVWEYCLDIASPTYADLPVDGGAYLSGAPDGDRILRGGSWSHNPAICRSAYRDLIPPDYAGWSGRIGLRVACTI